MAVAAHNAVFDEPDAGGTRDRLFSQFCEETDFQAILKIFDDLCGEISLNPKQYEGFYEEFKAAFSTSWKAKDLFQLFDGRAKQAEYCKQKACAGKRVLVIGAGPVGLRAAIEAAFLGAQVDLLEKRTSFNRNNLLHLWPFLLTDLRALGAKKFYGRFCSSSIDHIAIKILQSILLRTCLILGVKVHSGATFQRLVEPKNKNSSWMVETTPSSCPVNSYNFDVIISADGKQHSLKEFHSKEFRGRLALAITVNFVNSGSEKEIAVPEIGGVTSVYRQEFFNGLISKHRIDLENIVYYKGETHYFVMTAKKASLIDRKVIKKDCSNPAELLAKGNIDRKALEKYARDATWYTTEEQLKDLPFEKNHRGENDIALFDFTSLFKSENASRIVERKGKRILLCLAGDSLLEPFWPTGTGCAHGFLGVFDAAWTMKRFCAGDDPLEILEERESILYLLPQTTVVKLHKNFNSYSINPRSRYTNLSEAVVPDISHLYDTDDDNALQISKNKRMSRSSVRMKAKGSVSSQGGRADQNKSLRKDDDPISIVELEASPSIRKKRQTRSSPPLVSKSGRQPSVISSNSKSSRSSKESSKAEAEPDEKKAGPSKWSVFWSKIRGSRSATPAPDRITEKKKNATRSRGSVTHSISLKEVPERRSSVLDRINQYNEMDETVKSTPSVGKDEKKTKANGKSKGSDRSKSKDSSRKKRKDKKFEERRLKKGRQQELQPINEDQLDSPQRSCCICCWK